MTPPRPTRLRLPLSRILAGAAAAGLTIALPGLWSSAAVVPQAITNVSIRQTSTTVGSGMTLDLTWRVPDGTRAGDTFSLTLPSELSVLGGTDFALRDATQPGPGAVVANASVVGRVVTFTVTDYAESHTGVNGSAYFTVELSRSVQPGPHDLVFTADGTIFRDQIDVGVLPQNDYSTTATKWAKWLPPDSPGVPAEDKLLWSITGPRVTGPSPVTFTDTPGPGQAINCASFTLWSGTANIGGALVGTAFVPANRMNVLECSDSKAVVQVVPTSADVGKVFMLLGRSRVTDTTLNAYTNSGSVAVGGGSIPVTTVVAGAGGQGTGSATSTTTSATTSPTTSTTSPSTGTPTDTGTGTPTDTSTTTPSTTTSSTTPTDTGTGTPTDTGTGTPTDTGTGTPTDTGTGTPTGSTTSTTTGTGTPTDGSTPTGTATPPTTGTATTTTAPATPTTAPGTGTGTVTQTVTSTVTATATVVIPVPSGTVTVTAPPVATGTSVPTSSTTTSSTTTSSTTTSSSTTSSSTTSSSTTSSSTTSSATRPPVEPGTSTTTTTPPVQPGTSTTTTTTAPAVGAGSGNGGAATTGTRVTGVNTGIAAEEGPQALLVGGGIVLIAGSGAGLIAASRRRSNG